MREVFRDWEHLVRVGMLLAAGLVVFFVFSAVMTPAGFGAYGHFRGPALAEIAARPIAHAGAAACADCHDEVVKARVGSKHARIHCETCHGPLAAHADDPTGKRPERPNKRALCLGCHAASAAKPASFPQVEAAEHAATGDCTECHPHHHPEPGGGR